MKDEIINNRIKPLVGLGLSLLIAIGIGTGIYFGIKNKPTPLIPSPTPLTPSNIQNTVNKFILENKWFSDSGKKNIIILQKPEPAKLKENKWIIIVNTGIKTPYIPYTLALGENTNLTKMNIIIAKPDTWNNATDEHNKTLGLWFIKI